jgi:hypothetical protein
MYFEADIESVLRGSQAAMDRQLCMLTHTTRSRVHTPWIQNHHTGHGVCGSAEDMHSIVHTYS